MTTIPASPVGGGPLPPPGAALGTGNVIGAVRIAEKTIELTTCAQFGNLFGVDMVWFGLTQAQERQHGFDAATNLGGHAFILQFKASSTVLQTGPHASQRRFTCQHQQMTRLVNTFGGTPNSCFYFFPNVGTFGELQGVHGDLLSNAYLVDVADLPNPVPPTHRISGYHYAYLDVAVPEVTITSKPFKPSKLAKVHEWIQKARSTKLELLPASARLAAVARKAADQEGRRADLFFRNAALAVIPTSSGS